MRDMLVCGNAHVIQRHSSIRLDRGENGLDSGECNSRMGEWKIGVGQRWRCPQREVVNLPAYRIHMRSASIPLLDIARAVGCCSRDIANVIGIGRGRFGLYLLICRTLLSADAFSPWLSTFLLSSSCPLFPAWTIEYTHTLFAHLVTLLPSFIHTNSPFPNASVLHFI